ncbi:MAG: DUF502 domain-containing protein [Nitrospirae bacterium]|nr:DUF502 domain-containing protein [Nitrospirota bacterium]
MKTLTRYFFKGLLITIPVVATIYVVYIVFIKIDSLFGFGFPGLGIVLTFTIITLIGILASNFFTRWFVNLIDTIFTRLPLVKMIYTSLKDLINAFVGEKKGFNRPVMVRLLRDSDIYVLGFITQSDLTNLGITDKVAVYLPQAYNFAGNLLIVPQKDITPLKADSSDVMKFIISGGITTTKSRPSEAINE